MTIINLETNGNIFTNKKYFVSQMVRQVRDTGGCEFWVLNKQYLEVYYFKATQISDFDVQLDIENSLVQEHVFSGVFVLHMKDHILELLEEVPGTVYMKKLDCYRGLYSSLYEKASKTKTKKIKEELVEKIDFVESEFPQLVI